MRLHEDFKKLVDMWDGTVSIHEDKNGITLMTFTKKYQCLNNNKRDIILDKVLGSHNFMTVNGDEDGSLLFSITVQTNTLSTFRDVCTQLKTLENVDKLLTAVAI